MHAVSSCPLPVASLLWQPRPSAWVLTVVCRATFLLRPTELLLAPDQEHPSEHDDHWNDDDGRSLRVASDLVPMKLRADVTLVGNAFAPRGAAVRSLVARMLIGEIDKAIEVFCDRYFDQQGGLHEGPLFSRMPLRYERAAGGPETSNPVGVRGALDTYGRVALPNLQPPGQHVSSPEDHIAPTGFGPIAPGWPSRRDKLGRSSAGAPPVFQRPLPEDLDPSYFNHAPRDQQVSLLRDNERIILENLHPEHPRFLTSLPGLRPHAKVERKGSEQVVPLRCDTLWIDTDRALCTLTWRGQVPLSHPDEDGRVVVTLDAPPQAREPSLSALGHLQLLGQESATGTLVPTGGPLAPSNVKILPFIPTPSQPRTGNPGGAAGGGLPFSPVPKPASAKPPPLRPRAPASPRPPKSAPASGPASASASALAVPAPQVGTIETRRALQLVWFDPEVLPRLRRKPAFQALLAAVEERPLDGGLDDVFEVLARGDAEGEAELHEAVERGLRDDGKFVPPFVLIAGEVRFLFDELATLKATLSIAAPFAAADEPLKSAIAGARELISAPELMCPPGVIEGLTTRVEEAFRELPRAPPAGYLQEQTERVLLERRHYQRREVFGAPHLRALLQVGSAPRPWPLYLPEAAAKKLPMFARLSVKLLAEVCLQEDQYEPHPAALRASALARIAAMRR